MRNGKWSYFILSFIMTVSISTVSWAVTKEQGYELLREHIKARPSFEEALTPLDTNQKTVFQKIIHSLYFIDYDHSASELMALYLGTRTANSLRFPYMYNEADQPALEAYFKARSYLPQMGPKLTVENIQELHRIVLPWSVHSGQGPGLIRPFGMAGFELEAGLTSNQIRHLQQNPYLGFQAGTSFDGRRLEGADRAQSGDRLRGAIFYPTPENIRPEVLFRLEGSHPEIVREVLEFQAQHKSSDDARFRDYKKSLTQKLTRALLEERIATFEQSQAALGPLNSRYRIERYIRLVAQFQKDFISIHPFLDGNGRTSRLILSYLTQRKGLPEPRLKSPNDDLLMPLDAWEKQIYDGMISTVLLKKEIKHRIQNRLPLEKSVTLLAPALEKLQFEELSSFQTYLDKLLKQDPHLKLEFQKNPADTIQKIERSFYHQQPKSCSRVHHAS